MRPDSGYDYTAAGFDGFLSRSIDDLSQVNLDSQGPQSKQIRYDDAQVSGFMGDTLQIGKVQITKTNITMDDDNNRRLGLRRRRRVLLMGIGIKVSLPGNDTDSGDVNLAYSSEWPVLRIIKNGELKVLGETSTTIPHPLKFTPMILTWGPNGGFLNMPRQNIFVDSNNIYWTHPGTNTDTDDTSIMVFDVDIETAFNANAVNVSTSSSATSTSKVGIRFTKEGKDTSSHDLRDYILHSSTRTPLLHAVIPGTSNGSYTHDLPYSPIFLVFAQTDVGGISGKPYVLLNNFAGVTTDGKTITIVGQQTGYKTSIVILKDPFYIDSNITDVTI
jgi:hypothetical protein